MAVQNPPYAIQASSHGAALFRQAHGAFLGLVQPGSLALGTGGIVNAGDLALTQNGTPNMSVNSAGGSCFIPQTLAANGGVYFGLNDATVNLVISAANATNPRIDMIVAEVADAAYSGATNAWSLAVITGTPTGGATLGNLNGAPAQPSSSILVGYILVPANATTIVTADIADKRSSVQSGIYPLFANGTFPHGPHASSATGPLGTVATIVLPTATKIRYIWNENFSIPAAGLNAYTIQLTIDGAAMDVGGTCLGEGTSGGALPNVGLMQAIGTKVLAAGSHTFSLNITVGGAGSTITLTNTYWEIQAVGN